MKKLKPGGFTLVELLVVISIGGILIALVSAGANSAIARAKCAECISHLRTIGGATMGYAADNDMTLPATVHQRRQGLTSWSISLQPYASGKLSFKCPCDKVNRPYSYALNDFLAPVSNGAGAYNLVRLNAVPTQSATILFAESADGYSGEHFHFAGYRGMQIPEEIVKDQIAVERHGHSANYLFVDGHVENITWKQLKATLVHVPSTFIDPTAGGPTPTPTPYPY